jgi:transposase
MARYKSYSYDQQLMIPVSLSKQVLPKTFEYTLNVLIDEEIDLSIFDYKYSNDETGAPAYDPAILLKIILYAYLKGITGSRKIADLCQENIVCMALSADSRPHYTTIADFISSMDRECIELFTNILSVCYTENLIGKNMFAIDGCKISSNCSKEWSGTKSDLLKKSEKIKKSISYLVTKHKNTDENLIDEDQRDREEKSIKKLKEKAQIRTSWLNTNKDRIGVQNKPVKSNITDNESAKMATGHGVIPGYNGIAAVDDKYEKRDSQLRTSLMREKYRCLYSRQPVPEKGCPFLRCSEIQESKSRQLEAEKRKEIFQPSRF